MAEFMSDQKIQGIFRSQVGDQDIAVEIAGRPARPAGQPFRGYDADNNIAAVPPGIFSQIVQEVQNGVSWALRTPVNELFNLKLKAELRVKMGKRFPDFSAGPRMPSVLAAEFCIRGNFDLDYPWGPALWENCAKTQQK
jgi:hypothetical protein